MKTSKTLLAVLLAAMLVLALGVVAFAEGPTPTVDPTPTATPVPAPTTGTITITNAIKDDSYTIYKLFDAELDTSDGNTAPYPITYYVMSTLQIPDPDNEGEFLTVANPVYTLLTTNTTLKADFKLTGSTTVEGKYYVAYKNTTTTTLSAADVAAFQTLYAEGMESQLALLDSETLTADDDILTFSGIPFGYYMVASEDDNGKAVLNINSTNPVVNIALKAERNPSNPDKVEDRTEVGDAVCITYNTSVKAVNYVTSKEGTTSQVFNYSMRDLPDTTNGAAGNDAEWPKIVWVRVYDAAALEAAGKLKDDGSIKTKANGLYDLDGIDAYQTINQYAGTPLSHYEKDEDTNKYAVTWDGIADDSAFYVAVSENGTPDYYTIRIPWVHQPAEGSTTYESIYYPVSYIVVQYEQYINQNVNEIVGTTFDGTYVNYVDYKYDVKTATDIEIGSDSVKAFVTGLSLRKHATGETDDDKVLEGAVYIAYKTKTITPEEGDPYTQYLVYHEYTDDEYAAEVLKAENDFIANFPGKDAEVEDIDDVTADTKPSLTDVNFYMKEHPICHTTWMVEDSEGFKVDDFTTWKKATKLSADNSYSTVEIKNLTKDTFFLQEVEAPAGYLCPTVPYIVTVTPTTDMTNAQKHFTFTISNQGDANLPEAKIEPNSNNFYTAQLYDGTSKALPTTGGMGTTIIYIVGSVMLVGAAILLVTKKRMGAND